MGGGGSIAMMIATLKANERRRDRKNYLTRERRDFKVLEVKKVYSKELSSKEKNRIRLFSQNQKIREQMLNSVIFAMSVLLSILVIYLLIKILSVYFFKI